MAAAHKVTTITTTVVLLVAVAWLKPQNYRNMIRSSTQALTNEASKWNKFTDVRDKPTEMVIDENYVGGDIRRRWDDRESLTHSPS